MTYSPLIQSQQNTTIPKSEVDTMIKQKVGNRIRELRNIAGLSQEKLALAADLDRTYIASVENGKRNISIVNLEKIINALGSTFSVFFQDI